MTTKTRWYRLINVLGRKLTKMDGQVLTCATADKKVKDGIESVTRNKCWLKEEKLAMYKSILMPTFLYGSKN